MNKKLTSVAIGSAFAASLISGTAVATENPFGMNAMDNGYQVAMSGKADEGKCGEGKCGGDSEGKCGEGKCGGKSEGKCGEGKCGGKSEGKCGEGKCGH